ncbi:MAG: nickel pincer cofactor biosynthesis protein LarB [Chloroflexota bacterium]|nr:MAG: nickel pincer cofactor biosynthesis protein LarB [Chloroflexota bacterium]HDD62575.1 nickel pincer cofactor biosynthesis protein LarB [Chloroflexota bacterium]
MDQIKLEELLSDVKTGEVTVAEALKRLESLPFENLGFARLDLHRDLRQGLPEVVFCQNKTPEQIIIIMKKLWEHHDHVLGTRLSPDAANIVQKGLPEADYDPMSRLLRLSRGELPQAGKDAPYGMVVSGGTADQPVAEEAAITLEFLGSRVIRAYDIGVSGVHRLFDQHALLSEADVIISVAGMEGALTSVVGGLVSCPVIGVPTSVGYGANFQGISALLAMLNSCAPGIAVVNIDNGFGAAVYAHSILRRIGK